MRVVPKEPHGVFTDLEWPVPGIIRSHDYVTIFLRAFLKESHWNATASTGIEAIENRPLPGRRVARGKVESIALPGVFPAVNSVDDLSLWQRPRQNLSEETLCGQCDRCRHACRFQPETCAHQNRRPAFRAALPAQRCGCWPT